MKYIVFLIIINLLAGCSVIKPLNSRDQMRGERPEGVEFGTFNLNSDGSMPELIQNEETVRLGSRGGDLYTPENQGSYVSSDVAKKMRIGLALGPGLYRTINYIALLKYLEKENLAPQVITGVGLGGVVAAMYASGMTPAVIEWNFYRYFKEKRNYKVYSNEWVEEIDKLLLSKINATKIERTPKKFYLTLYNSKNGKTYFFDRGSMRPLLKQNLRLSQSVDRSSKKVEYTSSMESEVLNSSLLKKMGVDFLIAADVLGSEYELEDRDPQLASVFKKTVSQIQKEKNKYDFVFNLPVSKMLLDSTENSPMYLMNSQRFISEKSDELKIKVNETYRLQFNIVE